MCESYRKGGDGLKEELKDKYENHISEKNEVRKLKSICKTNAIESNGKRSAICFDLQQVILLPQSNRGELFYKRRLPNYNLTVYDMATSNGTCFM